MTAAARRRASCIAGSRRRAHRAALAALLLIALTTSVAPAAAQPATPSAASPQIGDTRVADPPVTFNQDIAPILHAHCAQCHRPGGAGPFNLLTFADASRRAAQLAAVTASGFMPPWKADGHPGEFVAQPRLTRDAVERIGRWARAPVEGPGTAPAPPRWPEGWYLGQPDLVVTLPDGYTLPGEPSDVFRIFAVPLPVTGTRYVRGIEFHPGNARVVHHANIRIDRSDGSRRLDTADPAPGYDGLLARSAEYPDGHFLGWTPGQIAPLVDADLSWRLDPGTDLVVQLHMQPSGKPEAVRPTIGFYFSDQPPTRTPSILRLGSQGIDIPPGDGRYVVEDRYTLPVDATLLAVQPHAHYRAADVTGTATFPDGATRTLIHIGGWDFRWQHVYRYSEPVRLPRGTTVAMRYVYDNSAENPRNPQQPPARVRWGQRSFDEMGDLWFQLATDSDADRSRLRGDVQTKMTAEDLIGLETMLASAPDDAELHDDAGVLALLLGRPAVAVSHFRASAGRRPQSAAAHYNVGTALTAAGLFDDAIAAYERALAINPRYAVALNNLGDTLMAVGRLADALPRYEAAVAADPTLPESRNNLGAVLWRRGDYPRAERALREALRLRPGYPEAHFNFGHLAIRTGDVAAAARHFRQAAAAKPEWVEAHTTAAWVLATAADPAVRAPAAAVELAGHAVALTARRDPRALDVLAVALASAGRFADAIGTAREALALAQPPLATAIAARLALFERGEAYVDRQ
jgi:tetratricopeptide (TPR) repeat protein/mono/diheme cytochrome c family protein